MKSVLFLQFMTVAVLGQSRFLSDGESESVQNKDQLADELSDAFQKMVDSILDKGDSNHDGNIIKFNKTTNMSNSYRLFLWWHGFCFLQVLWLLTKPWPWPTQKSRKYLITWTPTLKDHHRTVISLVTDKFIMTTLFFVVMLNYVRIRFAMLWKQTIKNGNDSVDEKYFFSQDGVWRFQVISLWAVRIWISVLFGGNTA